MRIYDPAERIVYVHLAAQVQRRGTPPRMDDWVPDRLPGGYANQSPRTRVRRDTGLSDSAVALESVAGARSGDRRPDPRSAAREGSEVRPA
ncbi:MAG: hypothetical protein M3P89_09585 [Actinomycetota bacterium]|nr:hypothetical protein [Actinomycetota bacterium]